MKRTTYFVKNHATGEILGRGLTLKVAKELIKNSTDVSCTKMYVETYDVVDLITGEIIHFVNEYDAEMEAERRLSFHKHGYNIRRNHVRPVSNAVLMVNGKEYIICTK